jgi:DNA-binding IclR family transcriptional regulator
MAEQDGVRQTVQSVVRAFDILKLFSSERPTLGVSEVAALTDLNRTTAHRLIATLKHCGALTQNPATLKYSLSAQLLQFSNMFVQTNELREIALGPMTTVRDLSGETCGLHVREGANRVIIAQVESRQALRLTYPNLGETVPLHIGAPGKAMLAFFDPAEINDYLKSLSLIHDVTTPSSVTDPHQVRQELEKIRQQGFAISQQERRSGVKSIAAPIFDKRGHAIASINISGPLQRIADQDIDHLVSVVTSSAADVNHALLHVDVDDRRPQSTVERLQAASPSSPDLADYDRAGGKWNDDRRRAM